MGGSQVWGLGEMLKTPNSKKRFCYEIPYRKGSRRREHSDNLGIDGRIILEWISGK
jgi:hypothetical protein